MGNQISSHVWDGGLVSRVNIIILNDISVLEKIF